MREKLPSEITQVILDDASYKGCGVSIEPTLLNFFFGNNGTGKSTIGRAIKADNGVTWRSGKSTSDYTVHVYNQEFIDGNLQNYHNLPGVFTVNEVNIAIQKQIDAKMEKKEKISIASKEATEMKKKKTAALDQALYLFQEECWEKASQLRRDFDKTQVKCKTKKAFASAILEKTPKEYDIEALGRIYAAAYSDDAKKYEEFAIIADPFVLTNLKEEDILKKKIVSSSDTPFAQFVMAMNATNWVQQGHAQYHSVGDGKCPYCQQKLPDSFEEDIRACFDDQYQESIKVLADFYDTYRNTANALFVPLLKVPVERMPGMDITPYDNKIAAVRGIVATNLQKISDKKADPALEVEIEDVADMLSELSDIIEGFNATIKENNAILQSKSKKQIECKNEVWEHIASLLSNEISRYLYSKTSLESEIAALTTEISSQRTIIITLSREIAELSKNSVNTLDTIISVNSLLKDSGFQGFSLREKEGIPNVFEVVRPDGTIAMNVSEGERNFIAFLYFYHLVKGSETSDGDQRDKIVVIDDPVSSMDSNSLFIISALVREMIEICENNAIGSDYTTQGRYIKQIFILTHNAYFHREITYNQVKNYQYVNLYLISKVDNKSFIKRCTKSNPDVLTEDINYNPVQNSYAALWEEYKVLNVPIPLMNVIRRILEYYFLQLCGYDGMTLRKRILIYKDRFIRIDANGKEDYTQYQMAHAMLSYISANSEGINDGMNFVDDCVDVEQTKETFRLIFTLMEQKQHYDMMMGITKGEQHNVY